MSTPRLEIDLNKIYHNAKILVERLGGLGLSVTGVTKSMLGHPEVANTLLQAGVVSLGDSRIENIETMHEAKINSSMSMIRTPMLSQVERIVLNSDISFNTELITIEALSKVASKNKRFHGVILMVETGDLREGIMPEDLEEIIEMVLSLPYIELRGLGTNLGCRNGVSPDEINMNELSRLVETIESKFDITLDIISGGNSSSLNWALTGQDIGRINNLRLGESILLGCEPLYRKPIEGLYTDAFRLVVEVIESKTKPSLPWGIIAQSTFGEKPTEHDRGDITQTILAIGRQDIDFTGVNAYLDIDILGASSDHLIVDSSQYQMVVGDKVSFNVNYSALLQAMTSPFVIKTIIPVSNKTLK